MEPPSSNPILIIKAPTLTRVAWPGLTFPACRKRFATTAAWRPKAEWAGVQG